MSEAIKPMPGPCWVDVHNNVKSARGLIAFPSVCSGCDQETVAHMIAQTFNVHHTTGLTPVQLVEQRDQLAERNAELVEALDGLLKEVDLAGLGTASDFGWPRVTNAARAALAKCQPKEATP